MTLVKLGNTKRIVVDDIATALLSFTSLRLYRATTRGGATTLVSTTPLVAGTTSYQVTDAAGLATDWYRWDLTGAFTSALTEWVPGGTVPAYSKLDLRRLVTQRLGLFAQPPSTYTARGPSGTVIATGVSSTVQIAAFTDALLNPRQYRGYYMLANDGAQVGKWVRVNTLAVGTGIFTLAGNFAAPLLTGVTVDMYGEREPLWWDRHVNAALRHTWVPFGEELAGITSRTLYRLPYYVGDTDQVTGLLLRTGTTVEQYSYDEGPDAELQELPGGGVGLLLPGAIEANAIYVLSGYRTPPELEAETDVVLLTPENLDLTVLTAASKAAGELMIRYGGTLEDRAVWESIRKDIEGERQGALRTHRAWVTASNVASSVEVEI